MAITLATLSVLSYFPSQTFAQTPAQTHYLTELTQARDHVAEFRWLSEWAEERGKRIFLAGGTASGFAVYVKQFIEQEEARRLGKPLPYFDSRFTWSYFDIYRSTQDADIVLEGTEDDAAALESALREKFPYMQGSKSTWEVRLLTEPRGQAGTPGRKDPLVLLDGSVSEFQKQHSDSYSTGLIELTECTSPVRDVADWKNEKDPQFLRDLLAGEITYYYRASHRQTKRYKEGYNPEILSVIRVLTKSFQYGGVVSAESRRQLEQVVKEFNPKQDFSNYAADQIRKNSLKLFWHSRDVEHSWNLLEELGLRKKLIEMGGESATWLNREPLRTFALGQSGTTAQELGIDIVAHETNSFLAFENITFSLRGFANVFRSRNGHSGEAAVHGDGFYTRMGREGARGTGLTVRFRMNPQARLGHDFTKVDDYIIVQNRAALDVIDETIELSPLHFIQFLSKSGFTDADRGVHEKMKIRLQSAWQDTTLEEIQQIEDFVTTEMAVHRRMQKFGQRKFDDKDCFATVVGAWFSQSLDRIFPAVTRKIFESLDPICRVQAKEKFVKGDLTYFDLRTQLQESMDPEIQNDFYMHPALVKVFWENYFFESLPKPNYHYPTYDPHVLTVQKKKDARAMAALIAEELLRRRGLVSHRVAVRIIGLGILSSDEEAAFYNAFKASAPEYWEEFVSEVIQVRQSIGRRPEWVADFFALGKAAVKRKLKDTQVFSLSEWRGPEFAEHRLRLVERFETLEDLEQFFAYGLEFKGPVDDFAAALAHIKNNHVLAGQIEQQVRLHRMNGGHRDGYLIRGIDEKLRSIVERATPGLAQEQVLEFVALFDGLAFFGSFDVLLPYIHQHPEWVLPWFDRCGLAARNATTGGGDDDEGEEEGDAETKPAKPLDQCADFIQKVLGGKGGIQFRKLAEQLLATPGLEPRYFDLLLTHVFLGEDGHHWTKRAEYVEADWARRVPDGNLWSNADIPKVMDLVLRTAERSVPTSAEQDTRMLDLTMRYVLSRTSVDAVFSAVLTRADSPHFREVWFVQAFSRIIAAGNRHQLETEVKYVSQYQELLKKFMVARGLDPRSQLERSFEAWHHTLVSTRRFHSMDARLKVMGRHLLSRRPYLDNLAFLQEWMQQLSVFAGDPKQTNADEILSLFLKSELAVHTSLESFRPVLEMVLRSPARGMQTFHVLRTHPFTRALPETRALLVESLGNAQLHWQVIAFLVDDLDHYSLAERLELIDQILAHTPDVATQVGYLKAVHWSKFPSTASHEWFTRLTQVADTFIAAQPIEAEFMGFYGSHATALNSEDRKTVEEKVDEYIKRLGYVPSDVVRHVLKLPAYSHRADWFALAVRAPHLNAAQDWVKLATYRDELKHYLLADDSHWLTSLRLKQWTKGLRPTLERIERGLGLRRTSPVKHLMSTCSDFLLRPFQ